MTVSAMGLSPASLAPSLSEEEVTELLNSGKFAAYHIEKAKVALAKRDFATAAYQIGASLAHDRLPEAVALKAEIKKQKAAK